MPRFSANLSMLYPEHAFLDRFAAAAADGFGAVEYVGAYAHPPELIAELLQRHGLEQALFNFPAGDWDKGERGLAGLPGRESEFRESIATAIRYAKATNCTRLNCLAGILPPGVAPAEAEAVLVGNLRLAAEALAEHGIQLLLEPINPRDMPGYLVNSSADFERIAALVDHPNLWLQYDFYHMQVVQGDLVQGFHRLQSRIAHVQVADHPGRHEPGSGEINYPFVFAALDSAGYDGWVGAEYRPLAGTSDGLGWFQPFRRTEARPRP
jgi:hydroxypyruvate isomerase